KLQAGYLFPEVARRVREFCEANSKAAERLIRCGIGDVTEPLPRAAVEAMKQALEQLGHRETFRGYGPEQGYEFLRSAIAKNVDLVYLCFPNNPTGAVASRAQLSRWVDYAREHDALLLFDAAYEAYISEQDIPHSIFEVPGARECAIELRSFSKNGGFTGVRCGFTVMPKCVLARTENGRRLPLHSLWQRRWSTKSNSVSYPVQRGAEALYLPEGREQSRALI